MIALGRLVMSQPYAGLQRLWILSVAIFVLCVDPKAVKRAD
jgi:hypothetical protein